MTSTSQKNVPTIWAFGILTLVIGWLFFATAAATSRADAAMAEAHVATAQSQDVKVQLSQIQTDIQWIKLGMQSGQLRVVKNNQ